MIDDNRFRIRSPDSAPACSNRRATLRWSPQRGGCRLKRQPARPGASPRVAALTSLHRAKLRRPAIADHYVHRARLLDLVEDVVHNRLTLVVAPAGTGKTSLVAGWVAESSTPTAWLSLDDTDRDGVQFWSAVIAALDTLAPGCGDGALAMLRRAGTRADAVDQLIADLDSHARPPAVLVVDDFHLVDDDDFVLDSVTRFVQSQPGWLHVVLVSRREPRLPIDRMRSRGQLGEIRFAELRFSPEEAVELMTRLSPVSVRGTHRGGGATGRRLGHQPAVGGARGALTSSADD